MSNWIVDNLQAALDFFNAMMQFLYDVLTINPATYRGGIIWDTVNVIYDGLLGVSISLCVIFFYLGILQDGFELIAHRKWEIIVWDLIKFSMMSGIIIYGRYILLLIFFIGKEFIDSVVLKNGGNLLETTTWISVPDSIVNATNGLTMSSGIVFWIVTLLAALVIMVSCFTILLVIYGRLFKIYLHISIAPVPLACFSGKATMHIFMNFIKSFFVVCFEGLVIVAACMIFSAFANGFDINNPLAETEVIEDTSEPELPPGYTEEEVQTMMKIMQCSREEAIAEIIREYNMNSSETKTANAQEIWIYLGETLFLFVMLAGIIKSSDDMLKRWVGV